jgi:hypothetical protein
MGAYRLSIEQWLVEPSSADWQRALQDCPGTSAISRSIGRAGCTMPKRRKLVDSAMSMVSRPLQSMLPDETQRVPTRLQYPQCARRLRVTTDYTPSRR